MRVCVLIALVVLSMAADYDYNLQVIELPGSVCLEKHCTAAYLGHLESDSVNYHGVWPNKLDGNHPFFCSQEEYDPSKLTSATRDQLLNVWNGLYSSTDSFLSHEYTKHGTCFKVPGEKSFLSQSNHQEGFFSSALDMLQRSGLKQALFSKSRTQETKWNLEELKGTLAQALGTESFVLNCRWDKQLRKAYVDNMQVCWTMELNVMDCPEGFRTTCRDNEDLHVTPLHYK